MNLDEILRKLTLADLHDDLTGTPLTVTKETLEKDYLPVIEMIPEPVPGTLRSVIAVAGPPGVGKSSFAQIITVLLDLIKPQLFPAIIGMDGWHYPIDVLNKRTYRLNDIELPLRNFKGVPESFDTEAFGKFLMNLRNISAAAYPVYDRRRHQTIRDGGMIFPENKVAIVEGNYLLLDREPWLSFQQYYDHTIMIRGEKELLRDRLMRRKIAGGTRPNDARLHVERVDLPNADLVLEHSVHADLTITV